MLVKGAEVIRKVMDRNVEGQMVVDFAKRMEIAVVNTYFKKKEDHRVTYKSGGRCTQVDYVLCRRCNLKEIRDCKVLAGDSVDRQHWIVACRMVLEVKKKRGRVRTERRIRWWKLKEEDCSVRFREELSSTCKLCLLYAYEKGSLLTDRLLLFSFFDGANDRVQEYQEKQQRVMQELWDLSKRYQQ
ncbi:hypothetical protein C0J50_5099 [Silurus asotus]|uniref:Uncharacterized protein n=1 Tax=Silurus asotus TaxID=30991 RepID=A0AAD5A6A7_SILAS|nr:hypothetical protein C0J50_5099 [Silurus asotus]